MNQLKNIPICFLVATLLAAPGCEKESSDPWANLPIATPETPTNNGSCIMTAINMPDIQTCTQYREALDNSNIQKLCDTQQYQGTDLTYSPYNCDESLYVSKCVTPYDADNDGFIDFHSVIYATEFEQNEDCRGIHYQM